MNLEEEHMSKNKKLFLGFLTFWPFAYMLIFFLFIFGAIFAGPGDGSGLIPISMAVIFPLHLITMLVAFGMMIYYIVDIFKNKNVKEEYRVIWVLVLFLGGILGSPVYWYMNIWKDPDTSSGPLGLNNAESFQEASNFDENNGFQNQERRTPEPMSWRDDD